MSSRKITGINWGRLAYGGLIAAAVGSMGPVLYVASQGDSTTTAPETAGTVAEPRQPDPQKTASFYLESNDRRYILWDGLVMEELSNNTGYSETQHSLGKNIYDFDLRIIFHLSDLRGTEPPQRTLFSETADENGRVSPHIDHVRGVACELATGYFMREASGEYGAVPADIQVFQQRHCPAPAP